MRVVVAVLVSADRVLRVIVVRMPGVGAAFIVTMRAGRRLALAIARDAGWRGTRSVFHRSSRGRSETGSVTCSSMSASIPLICRSAAT